MIYILYVIYIVYDMPCINILIELIYNYINIL